MLHPQQIIAGRHARRDGDRDRRQPARSERDGIRRDRGVLLVDLEPDVSFPGEGSCSLSGGDFGKVELERPRVLDGGIDAEADGVTGRNGLGGIGAFALDELVAADLRVGHVLNGTVAVVVGRFTNVSVGPISTLSMWALHAWCVLPLG